MSSKYNGKLELSHFRKLEKIFTKAKKAELDISFLASCQKLCSNVFPKLICFQLPNVSKYDVNAIQKRLLKRAITKRCKGKRKLQNERDKIESKIKQVLTGIDFFIF